MIFFNFSQFFTSQGPNAFYEEFLKTEALTLEQLLDHEDTVTEVKKSNAGLLSLVHPQLPRLLQYITEEPSSDASELVGHRYPFIACEILNSDSVLVKFGSDFSLFPILFNFLESEKKLNLTLAGYCALIAQRVLERHSNVTMEFLLLSEADYPSKLLRHINNRAVAEFLVNVLGVNAYLPQRQALFQRVLFTLSASQTREVIANVGFAIQELIRRSADVGEWKQLATLILSTEVLQHYARHIATEEAGEQISSLLSALLNHNEFRDIANLADAAQDGTLCENLKSVVAPCVDYLNEPITAASTATTYGQNLIPLGQTRLSLILFVNNCIKTLGSDLDVMLIESGFLRRATQLFCAYPWNSGLHHVYEQLVRTVLEDSSPTLKTELIVGAGLVDVLVTLGNEATLKSGTHWRKGFMGHVTHISNMLLSLSSINPFITQFLEHAEWSEYMSKYLTPQNITETSKYLDSDQKESVEEMDRRAQEKEEETAEAEDDDDFEFKLSPSYLKPEDLDKSNLFSFDTEKTTTDPELEPTQGTDLFNDLHFWHVPIGCDELEDLD